MKKRATFRERVMRAMRKKRWKMSLQPNYCLVGVHEDALFGDRVYTRAHRDKRLAERAAIAAAGVLLGVRP